MSQFHWALDQSLLPCRQRAGATAPIVWPCADTVKASMCAAWVLELG